jgi:hypothetical protein
MFVFGRAFLLVELRLLDGRLQDLEGAHQIRINRHDSTRVVELVAVVRRAEDGDQLALREELVAILDDLMRAANQVEVMLAQELLDDVGTEGEGHTSVVLAPSDETFFGVGPQEIANEAGVGDIARTDNLLHLLHDGQFRRQATVAAENLVVDDAGYGEAVEGVGERLPELDVVTPLALVEEAVDAVDASALVVATEDEEVLGELDLEGEDEADGLEALLATVHVVAEEEVVRSRRETTVFEQAEEVVVLTVDVTADLDGGLEFEEGGLGHDDFTRLEGYALHVVLGQLHLLAWLRSADFQQLVDDRIDVEAHGVEGVCGVGGLCFVVVWFCVGEKLI